MESNSRTGSFSLTDEDIRLLGEPTFNHSEPFSVARSIYDRAEARAAMNQQRGLEAPRPGIDRNNLIRDITSVNIRLVAIMGTAALHVPELVSPAHSFETHLPEWARSLGIED